MILTTHSASRSVLLLAVLLVSSPVARAQERPRSERLPELTSTPSDVKDTAGLFSSDAIRAARETLQKLEKSAGVATLVETVESLKGENVDEAAIRLARRSGLKGVFILIARKESKIEVLSSRAYAEALPRPVRNKVRQVFIDEFRKWKFDDGLRQGVAALEGEVRKAELEGRLPRAEKASVFDDQFTQEVAKRFLPGAATDAPQPRTSSPDDQASRFRNIGVGPGSLVVRNQVRLTLEGARVIIHAAEERAGVMKLKMNIAVVDDGGHLLAFERMEGARPASGYTSLTKAITAATFRQPTGPIPAGTTNPDPILNLSLQNAALASGGKITTLYGGVPVTVDGQVIGGVGVGGGSGEQDAQVARAGIDALLERLKSEDRPRGETHGVSTKVDGAFEPEKKEGSFDR
jgi:glc operon protein GlcG